MGMDRDRGIDRHLPLRGVEFHILLSLAAGERHGYGIIQDIEARGETSVPDVGTIYRALARMVRRTDRGVVAPAGCGCRRRAPQLLPAHECRPARRSAEARRLEALMRAHGTRPARQSVK